MAARAPALQAPAARSAPPRRSAATECASSRARPWVARLKIARPARHPSTRKLVARKARARSLATRVTSSRATSAWLRAGAAEREEPEEPEEPEARRLGEAARADWEVAWPRAAPDAAWSARSRAALGTAAAAPGYPAATASERTSTLTMQSRAATARALLHTTGPSAFRARIGFSAGSARTPRCLAARVARRRREPSRSVQPAAGGHGRGPAIARGAARSDRGFERGSGRSAA